MNRPLAFGYTFLVVAILLWAGNAVVSRAAVGADTPPIALNFWRWVVAFAIIAPFTAASVWHHRTVFLKRWWYFTAFGAVSIAGFNAFFYTGLQYTTVVQGTLIQSILPVLVLLLGALFLGEGVSARQAIGVVFSIAGAVLILLRGDAAIIGAMTLNVGDLWCLGAVFLWALQTFLLRWKPPEVPMTAFMTVVIAIGVVVLAPFYLWEAAGGRQMPVTAASIASVLYLGLFASVIAATLFNVGVVRVGPATSGYFGNLYPVFSAVLAMVFLGESLAWFHIAGGVLVLGGISFATVDRRRHPEAG